MDKGLKELCQAVEDTHAAYFLAADQYHAPALPAYLKALGDLGRALLPLSYDARKASTVILATITEAEERGRREGLGQAADAVLMAADIHCSEDDRRTLSDAILTIRVEVTP